MSHPHLALATAISRLERGEDEDLARTNASSAHVVGISGPPGAGKSVLIGRLVEHANESGLTLGVLAIDPSSPVTGGAILADRLRIPALPVSQRIFIRSLASRGALGGLSRVCHSAARLLESSGFNLIIVETVGVGQNETDILNVADTVIIVQAPGNGDEVQAIKAGILEIADIFVVNKADLPDAALTVRNIRDVAASISRPDWEVPVAETSALHGTGIAALWTMIDRHKDWLHTSGRCQRRRIRGWEHYLGCRVMERVLRDLPVGQYAARVANRELSAAAAVDQLVNSYMHVADE